MAYPNLGTGNVFPIFSEIAWLNHVPTWTVTGGSGSGSIFEVFIRSNAQELEVSLNGGILPLLDANVLMMAPFGVMENDNTPDEFHYQIDRISIPNKIVFGAAPEDTNNYVLFIQNY